MNWIGFLYFFKLFIFRALLLPILLVLFIKFRSPLPSEIYLFCKKQKLLLLKTRDLLQDRTSGKYFLIGEFF